MYNSLLQRLKERNVLRTVLIYIATGWAILQAIDFFSNKYHWPSALFDLSLAFVISGLPFAIIRAWFHGGPGTHGTSRKEVVLLSINCLLAIAGMSYGLLAANPLPIAANLPNSIAVKPFENLSNDPDQEFFSVGLTEDIITQLAKIKSLRVTSRSSIMQYKESMKTIRQIGGELGVSYVLEGSVQRNENVIRITAQLIVAASDEHVWAESYDRPVSVQTIFDIQREVAVKIASYLKSTLTPEEEDLLNSTLPTKNLEAYDLYQRGKFAMEIRTKPNLMKSIEWLEQAIEKDSSFANAYAALADAYTVSWARAFDDPKKLMPKAMRSVFKAFELNPESGLVHAALGNYYHHTFNFRKAESEYRKALELDSNQTNVYYWFAGLLDEKDQREDALKVADAGLRVNPGFTLLKGTKAGLLFALGRTDESFILISEGVKEVEGHEEFQSYWYRQLARQYWEIGKRKEAIAAAEKMTDKALFTSYNFGDQSILLSQAAALEKQTLSGEAFSYTNVGRAYFDAGQHKKAIAWFNMAIERRETYILDLLRAREPVLSDTRKKVLSLVIF
jgi:adenylate cyclase